MANILVTGGAGYIGGILVDYLLYRGHSVTVYDSLVYEDLYLKNSNERFNFVQGDIRDRERLKKLYGKTDVVIWLAALVGDPVCKDRVIEADEINTLAVEVLAEDYDGRIVFPSTCSVYGIRDELITEDSPINPLSTYAETKLHAELFLQDKDAVILRLGTLFGLGDSYSRLRLDLVVNYLTIKGYTDKKFTVFGGDQYRPLMHVGDVGRAMMDVMFTNCTGVYNLAAKNITIAALALGHIQPALRQVGVECEIDFVQKGMEDLRNYRVDFTKAIIDWNFNPSTSINYGIHQMINLMRSGRLIRPKSWRFNNAAHLDALEDDRWKI